MELGYSHTPLRRRLVDAVLSGEKTATASLRSDYSPHTDELMPAVGCRYTLVDFDDRPVAIVETTEVRVVAAKDVDIQFAQDEGEGFTSVAEWRTAHERFWSDHEITDDSLIVCQRFRLTKTSSAGS